MKVKKDAFISARIPAETNLIIQTLAEARGISVSTAVHQIILKGLPYWQGTAAAKMAYNRTYQTRKRQSLASLKAGDVIILPDDSEAVLTRPGVRKGLWDCIRQHDQMNCTVPTKLIRFKQTDDSSAPFPPGTK